MRGQSTDLGQLVGCGVRNFPPHTDSHLPARGPPDPVSLALRVVPPSPLRPVSGFLGARQGPHGVAEVIGLAKPLAHFTPAYGRQRGGGDSADAPSKPPGVVPNAYRDLA